MKLRLVKTSKKLATVAALAIAGMFGGNVYGQAMEWSTGDSFNPGLVEYLENPRLSNVTVENALTASPDTPARVELASLVPTINTVTVNGNNQVITGDSVSETRFFVVGGLEGKTFSLNNLTLRDAMWSENGAAIEGFSFSEIDINSVKFINNMAVFGGAVSSWSTGPDSLVVSNSEFTANYASSSGGAVDLRAGIISGTIFTDNAATLNGGAINGFISLHSLDISSSIFSGNSANHGGAIFVSGSYRPGMTSWTGSVLDLSDVDFTQNIASDDGGAMYASGMGITQTNAMFSENFTGGDGGAVFAEESIIRFHGTSIFAGNAAMGNGGAIRLSNSQLTISGETTFDGNSASAGGAIFADAGSSVTIVDSTFTDNLAMSSDPTVPNGSGGAIVAGEGAVVHLQGENVFSGNSAGTWAGAILVLGGSVHAEGTTIFAENTAATGGAIFVNGGSLTIKGAASFTSNSASDIYPDYAEGGAIWMEGGTVTLNPTSGNTVFFSGNTDHNGTRANSISLGWYGNELVLDPEANASILFYDPIAGVESSYSGQNTVTKTGAGLVQFHGDSEYYGDTIVSDGTFEVAEDSKYGARSSAGNTFMLASGNVSLRGGARLEAVNVFQSGGSMDLAGNARLVADAMTFSNGTLDLKSGASVSTYSFAATGGLVRMGTGASFNASISTSFDRNTKLRFTGTSATFNGDLHIANSDSIYYEGISKDGAEINITVNGNLSGEENPFGNKQLLNVSQSGDTFTVTPKSYAQAALDAGFSENTASVYALYDEARNAATDSERIRYDDEYNMRDGFEFNEETEVGDVMAPVEMLTSINMVRSIGNTVMWRQSSRQGLNSSLVPSNLVRGQRCPKCSDLDIWFQGYTANMNVWSRTEGRTGYNATRNGGVLGINKQLGDRTVGGLVFGYSNPYLYDRREKIDLDDFQFGVHVQRRLGDHWEFGFFIGGGTQDGDSWRTALHTENGVQNAYRFRGDYDGNTLSSTITLSRVIKLGERSALRPTIGIDTEHAWFFRFTENAYQSLAERENALEKNLNISRRTYLRSYYDRTMVRIGAMAQTGGSEWGLNGRLFYSPQIGGAKTADTRILLNDLPGNGTANVESLPLGREFVTIGAGGHLILNKKKTLVLYADYNANLFKYATTQNIAAGVQYSF